MEKGKSGIGFIPYKGMVALAVPTEAYPNKDVVPTEQMWKAQVNEKAQELVNGELIVAAIGEGIDFVSLGDKVVLTGRTSVQTIETQPTDKKRYCDLWWIVRESDILVKFD